MPMGGGHSDNNHSNDNHSNGNKSNGNHRDGNHSNSGDSSDSSDSDSDSNVTQFPVALTFSYLSLCCCSNFLLFMFWRKAFVLVVFD